SGSNTTAGNITTAASNTTTASTGRPTLSIAENVRFVPRFAFPAQQAARLGRVTHFSVKVMSLMPPSSKWFATPWRQTPAYQGGFLLDGGVHHAAAARLFLCGPDNRPASVRAFTDRVRDFLPPIDTVTAIVRTASGATGTFQHSAGTLMEAFEWEVACERGTVRSAGETVTAPEEALADLEFLEKMFRSGEQDGALLEYELQL
ncbi:Uncharacterized protein TOPH_07710, partial [Tolypocladium ophioglossoides CBS 100239]